MNSKRIKTKLNKEFKIFDIECTHFEGEVISIAVLGEEDKFKEFMQREFPNATFKLQHFLIITDLKEKKKNG